MENLLFGNAGSKIKGTAIAFFIIGVIISLLLGIFTVIAAVNSGEFGFLLLSIVLILGGIIISWISTVTLYGFGQLIENTDIIRCKLTQ